MMELTKAKLSELTPYAKNPRLNDQAVSAVAESIKQCTYVSPIIVDEDFVILAGHTRFKALQRLGYDEIDVLVKEGLSEAQKRKYRLLDNKVGEFAEWDFELLDEELDGIDFEGFDFGFPEEEFDDFDYDEPDYKLQTQQMVYDILNLGYGQFEGAGAFDIPKILPVYEVPEVDEWISFNYVLSDKNPKGKGVHFFIDDYQFERVWNNPLAYIEKLSQYEAVIAPDFSPYGDMPLATQLFNHYRKHWCARLWQEYGVNVIPCIRSSNDERFLDYYLDGEPENSVVCISTMWCSQQEARDFFVNKEFKSMKEKLNPKHIIIYGRSIDEIEGDFSYIETFTDKRWNRSQKEE